MIKVVLFDADGILINGEMFSVQLARDYGINAEVYTDFEDFDKKIGQSRKLRKDK